MDPVLIRRAVAADAAAINDIYNHYVRTSTCTYQRDPDTLAGRLEWLSQHADDEHPATVAEQGGVVVGWGSLTPYHRRWGYRHTVESSVYVRTGLHRSGIGRALLADLLARARSAGHHAVIAGVDGEQAASRALHEAHGFLEVGRLREVGHKFDRWLDVVYLQLAL